MPAMKPKDIKPGECFEFVKRPQDGLQMIIVEWYGPPGRNGCVSLRDGRALFLDDDSPLWTHDDVVPASKAETTA